MPTRLYILCGPPYAGKSTLARALVERFGWERIAIDDINSERGLGLAGQPITLADWDSTYAVAFQRLREALARGATVVFDAGNFTRQQRDDLRVIAHEHAITARVISVTTPESVARARWQANRRDPRRPDVRDDDFASAVAAWEPPENGEDAIIFDGRSAAMEWVLEHFE